MKINVFFLFQPNTHNMINKYIYYLSPATCFGVCYTIFRETTVLFSQELYAFCNPVTQVVLQNINYTLWIKICSARYIV